MSEPTEPSQTPPSPPQPPEEPPVQAEGNAWERRAELGFVDGFIAAVKLFITSPGQAFSETRKSGDLGSPLLYAVIISVVTAMIGQLWAILFGTSLLALLPADFQQAIPFWMMSQGAGFMVSFVVVPIATVVWVFLWGAIMHVLLLLVGGLESSEGGFEGTLRVVAYSSTGNVAKLVPVIGDMVSTLWMIVLAVIGLTRLHGTSEGKAVTVVLLPLILCCVCLGVAVMMGVGAVMSGMGD